MLYQKHEMELIKFDRNTVFATWIGSFDVLPDDDDEDGDD